jgi:amino acid transporter
MPAAKPQPCTPSPADERLERAIGPWGLAANAVNTTVGAGIFVLPGLVAGILGPAAVLAYLICGLAIGLALTCFIEIGSQVSRSGGAVAYIGEAFGPMAGFLAWVIFAVGVEVTVNAALANALIDSIASAAPPLAHAAPRAVAIALLLGALAAANFAGVRQGMRVAVTITVAKLLPLLLLVAAGPVFMRWHELRWIGLPPAAKLGEASFVLFFAFLGAEVALTPSGEIREPARTVPRAIFGATAFVILLYVALQVVSQGVLGSALGQESNAPLAAAGAHIFGTAGRSLFLAGAAVSILGSMAGAMVSAPRAYFLAARDGMLPARLAAVHPRYRTPHAAIVVFAACVFVVAVSGTFRLLAELSVASILCIYLAVCLGALRLRFSRNRLPGAFRAPGGPVVPVLAAGIVLWLLAHSARAGIGAVLGTLALAAAYYAARRHRLHGRPQT